MITPPARSGRGRSPLGGPSDAVGDGASLVSERPAAVGASNGVGSILAAELIEPLEQLIFESIGLTAFALGAASARELTLGQWRALVVLGRHDGMRVGEIRAAIGGSLPSTSRLIGRLERHGLVTTERDASDRRATLVRMTDKGRTLRAAVIAARRQAMEAALAAHAPRLPRSLVPGLAAIARAFDQYR